MSNIYCFKSAQFLKTCLVSTITEFGEIIQVHEYQSLAYGKDISTNERSKVFYEKMYPDGVKLTWIDSPADPRLLKAVRYYEAAWGIPFAGKV